MQGGVGKWAIKDWNVDELIGKNFLFFEAQESGRLPPDHRIQWRGDSYKNDKQGRVRLDGGWFDAGGTPGTFNPCPPMLSVAYEYC